MKTAALIAMGVISGTLLFTPHLHAAPPSEVQSEKIKELVEQLGHEEFSSREQATEALLAMGLTALPALREGLRHPDREIRFRCNRILHFAKRIDFNRRLEAFAANEDNLAEPLPGWERFRKTFGGDPAARSIFVEMQRAESELLEATEKQSERAIRVISARCQELQLSTRVPGSQMSMGSVATMLFVITNDDLQVPSDTTRIVFGFCYQPTFQAAISDEASKDVIRKLLGTMIARSEPSNAYQALSMSMRFDIEEGLQLAETTLKNGNQAYVLQYAMLTIAKLGDEKYTSVLESFLEDKTKTTTRTINNVTFETQIRDVALASLIHLADEDPADFGFSRIQRHQQVVFSTSTLGFKGEEERQAAFDKWEEFKARAAKAQQDGDQNKVGQ